MVRVAEANLYYEVRGSGPVLLIIQGGTGDADHSNALVDHLTDHYTLVTYDRRGLSRSAAHDPTARVSLARHSDDALQVLAAVTTKPAFVVGFSIGAVIGLELSAHHPEQVRRLVAHEPPVLQLLPSNQREHAMRVHEDVVNTYRRDGVAAAVPKMLAMAGVDVTADESQPRPLAPTVERIANLEFFLGNDLPVVMRYTPDMAALTAMSARITVAAGRSSTGVAAHQCADALAQELGTPAAEFPGGHAGATSHPEAFAARLRDALNGPDGRLGNA